MVNAEPHSIERDAIRDLLERLRAARSAAGNPLDALQLVSIELDLCGLPPTAWSRSWVLAEVVTREVGEALERCRGRRAETPRGVASRVELERDLVADFAPGDKDLEGWSCVYHRFLSPHPFQVQEMAALVAPGSPHGRRTITRRLERGYALLGERLMALESQALRQTGGRMGRHAMRPAPDASASEPTARRGNLPVPVSAFVGRASAIAELGPLVTGERLVTLHGIGGIGKSRLALEVAARVGSSFGAGAWFVDLAPVVDDALVPQAVGLALGLEAGPDATWEKLITEYADEASALVLIDNCEHMVPEVRRVVALLTGHGRGVHVLATSRTVLDVAGEVSWPVPPLAVPPPAVDSRGGLDLTSLSGCEAVQLFVDRCRLVVPGFDLNAANAPAVASICRRLDGLPLAIELAAARARVLSPAEIDRRLDDRFRLLTSRAQTSRRHESLWVAFATSVEPLEPPERALFARLAVFRGGWSLEAAEGVCAGETIDAEDVLDGLTTLVEHSLVVPDVASEPTRYGFPESVGEFARQLLAVTGSAAHWQDRHLGHFLDLAERARAETDGMDRDDPYRWLDADQDNLRAALEWSRAGGQPEAGLRLCIALSDWWRKRGLASEARAQFDAQLAATVDSEDVVLRARALNSLGVLLFQQGDSEASAELHLAGLAILRAIDDKDGIARTLHNLATVRAYQGDLVAADDLEREALACFEAERSDAGMAASLYGLAVSASLRGDDAGARTALERVLEIDRRSGDKASVAASLTAIATASVREGRPAEALPLIDEAITLCGQVGDIVVEAEAMVAKGSALAMLGQAAEARSLFRECLDRGRHNRYGEMVANALCGLGEVAMTEAGWATAHHYLGAGLSLQLEQSLPLHAAETLVRLAAVAGQRSQPTRAVQLLAAADRIRREHGVRPSVVTRGHADAAAAAARAALDGEDYAAAWDAGGSLTLADAVALALTEAG